MVLCTETIQSPRLALAFIIGDFSTLPILELAPEDLQDNILADVGDALIIALAEEMAAESVTTQNRVEDATSMDPTA